MDALAGIVLFLIAAGIYFIPAIVAYSKSRHNTAAIFMLNLFLGWTFLGWVVALIWAMTDTEAPSPPAAPQPMRRRIKQRKR